MLSGLKVASSLASTSLCSQQFEYTHAPDVNALDPDGFFETVDGAGGNALTGQ